MPPDATLLASAVAHGLPWCYPAVVVLLAYGVLGVSGFGSALVAVPLLTWQWPLAEVVPLVVSMDVVASALHGRLNLARVRWRELLHLVPGMLAGVALGALLTHVLRSQWPLLALGLYVVWAGTRVVRGGASATAQAGTVPPRGAAWQSTSVGVVVGVIEVMFGTSGPPLIAWLTRRFDDVQAVRATAPVALAAAGVIALLGFAADGRLLQALHWQRFSILAGLALLAVLLGHRLGQQMPAARLRQVIGFMLVASGLLLAGRALSSLVV